MIRMETDHYPRNNSWMRMFNSLKHTRIYIYGKDQLGQISHICFLHRTSREKLKYDNGITLFINFNARYKLYTLAKVSIIEIFSEVVYENTWLRLSKL